MPAAVKYGTSLLDAVQACLDRNLNFAAYRLPFGQRVRVVIQRDPLLDEMNHAFPEMPGRGFLISPFARGKGNPVYLLKPDILLENAASADQMEDILALPEPVRHIGMEIPEETQKADYIRRIGEIIGRIRNAEFEKVMLSRIKTVRGNFMARLPRIFQRLCQAYDHAFVFLFSVNGNCWAGATPEPFICSDKG